MLLKSNKNHINMSSKHILLILIIGIINFHTSNAQTNFKLQNIELDFNDNSIGRSLQLQLQAQTGPLLTSIGLRYHFKEVLKYNSNNVFYKTMHPIKFIQHFGPTLSVVYNYEPKKFSASFFVGYKTEVGIMARKILFQNDIDTRTPTYYNLDSPLIRWDNQIILGSTLPVTNKIRFKIYGGVGVSGIFNIEEDITIFTFADSENSKTQEFSASFGCGLSYNLFGKNKAVVN